MIDVTRSTFAATTTSAEALAVNTRRKYLFIQNNTAVSIHIKFGGAHSGTEGITITTGNYIEFKVPIVNSVYIRTASSSGNVEVLSGEGQLGP